MYEETSRVILDENFYENSENQDEEVLSSPQASNPDLFENPNQKNVEVQKPPYSAPPKGKRNRCKKVFLCCFGTRQIAKGENDKNAYIRTTILELIIYLVYLTICCIMVYGSFSPTDYYYTKVLSDLFLDTPFNDETRTTFRTSTHVNDFWKFAESTMLNGLYWEYWYDDVSIKKPVENEDRGILYENKLLGRPRLRQIRVKDTLCPVDHLIRSVKGKCYPDYHPDNENTADDSYGSFTPNTAWFHYSEEHLQGRPYWGKLHTYAGSGSFLLLEPEQFPALLQIVELKQHLWIKRATRAIFLEFTVYNANINMFCVVKLAWEFAMTGGLVTSWSIRAARLFRYISAFDFFIFACEIIFVIFTIYYTIQEIVELCVLGIKRWLLDLWSYLDVLILILSYLCISFSIYRSWLVFDSIGPLINKTGGFADFDFLAFWDYLYNTMIGILLFFIWVKIFKYISFNATMSQLSITLSRCAKDIGGFAVMFFIVFFAFAQLGHLLFGSQVQDYSTLSTSIFTLLRLILGDFDFASIENANRFLGPLYFISYVFFVFFVLLNMFLAIINDTYGEVKAEIHAQKGEFLVMDYLREKLRFNKANKSGRNSVGIGDVADDGKITPGELKRHLLRANFTEPEVDLFLARYELNQDHSLDVDETQVVIEDMEGLHHHDNNNGDQQKSVNEPNNETEHLENRITTMEASLTQVLGKMDVIITKLNPVVGDTSA